MEKIEEKIERKLSRAGFFGNTDVRDSAKGPIQVELDVSIVLTFS